MIKVDELFDWKLYLRMLQEGFVRVQTNPDNTLFIANYSEKAQFNREWNEVTLNCRGLIYDLDSNVVARGFKKFFNWDDSSQPFPPTGPCLRMPKMDGSLGILYLGDDDEWKIATRGSFTSDQAIKATDMLENVFVHNFNAYSWERLIIPRRDRSYLFEIIFPANRIVVDYGQEERLVLLAVLDTATGAEDIAEFDSFTWPDKVDKVPMPGFQDTMASDIPQGEEGFVFYWPQKDFRVKMKAAEYIELHRMIFGLSARSVWQRMGEGETVEEIAEKLPDEFHDWVRNIGNSLLDECHRISREARNQFTDVELRLPPDYTRKQFAELAIRSPLRGLLFMLADGRDIETTIWADIKPAGNINVTTISEDVA